MIEKGMIRHFFQQNYNNAIKANDMLGEVLKYNNRKSQRK